MTKYRFVRMIVIIAVSVLVGCVQSVHGVLPGPDSWDGDCNAADSKKQSPIDIDTKSAVAAEFSSFNFNGYSSAAASLINNGHTVQANVGSEVVAQMNGGDLEGTFRLAQFHFHWGKTDSEGSEHELDGKQYPLEVHFVHYNTKYADLTTAAGKDDGLAVLGFFFKIGAENAAYKKVTDSISKVATTKDVAVDLPTLDLLALMPSRDGVFYRYPGGLTTPPCTESVTWTVFETPIEISSAQMALFRTASDDGEKIAMNFRPVQPLNGRTIKTNKDDSGATSVQTCMALLLSALVSFFLLK